MEDTMCLKIAEKAWDNEKPITISLFNEKELDILSYCSSLLENPEEWRNILIARRHLDEIINRKEQV
jgi:hypothetical protein